MVWPGGSVSISVVVVFGGAGGASGFWCGGSAGEAGAVHRFRHPQFGQRRWLWWCPQLSHSVPGWVMFMTLVG